jgi:hypothetical protein
MIFTKKIWLLLIFYFAFQTVVFCSSSDTDNNDSLNLGKDNIVLDKELVTHSLNLCKDYILKNQKFIGNFNYQYNLITKKFAHQDNSVRQAATTWALSLYYNETGDTIVEKALLKALDFFISYSRITDSNERFFIYPGENTGDEGAVAMVSLALIDYLRSANDLSDEKNKIFRQYLDEFIKFLLLARDSTNLWHSKYNHFNGKPYDMNSPYYDGESLLALVKAAKYLNRGDLVSKVLQSADKCYERYVEVEIKQDTSNWLKSFYQWGVMSYFEIITSGWPNIEKYGDYINLMTDWMIDMYKVDNKLGAVPYEGILHAYKLAIIRNDEKYLLKLKPIIETNIIKQIRLQVGGPIPNNYSKTFNITDNRIIGGILSPGLLPLIRIDNVQHQMSALLYTRCYYFNKK